MALGAHWIDAIQPWWYHSERFMLLQAAFYNDAEFKLCAYIYIL